MKTHEHFFYFWKSCEFKISQITVNTRWVRNIIIWYQNLPILAFIVVVIMKIGTTIYQCPLLLTLFDVYPRWKQSNE